MTHTPTTHAALRKGSACRRPGSHQPTAGLAFLPSPGYLVLCRTDKLHHVSTSTSATFSRVLSIFRGNTLRGHLLDSLVGFPAGEDLPPKCLCRLLGFRTKGMKWQIWCVRAHSVFRKKVNDDVRSIISSLQSVSHVQLFATPWTVAHQASLSMTNSQSLLKLMFIDSVMPFNHLILCCPLLLLPLIFPSIRVFSNESVLHIRWPKYWSFSFSIRPSSEYSGLISFKID